MAGKGQPKTGGRRPGSQNKAQVDLLERIRKRVRKPTWDPVIEMAAFAADVTEDKELRLKALREVSRYVHPTLKSIEHSGALDVGVSGVLRVPTGPANEDEWEDDGDR